MGANENKNRAAAQGLLTTDPALVPQNVDGWLNQNGFTGGVTVLGVGDVRLELDVATTVRAAMLSTELTISGFVQVDLESAPGVVVTTPDVQGRFLRLQVRDQANAPVDAIVGVRVDAFTTAGDEFNPAL